MLPSLALTSETGGLLPQHSFTDCANPLPRGRRRSVPQVGQCPGGAHLHPWGCRFADRSDGKPGAWDNSRNSNDNNNNNNNTRRTAHGRRGERRGRALASWRRTGPRQLRGLIKSARAFRLPPGVDPVDVERRVTVDADSGKLLEDIASGTYGLRACEAGRRLDAVRNLDVCVELRDPGLACNFAEDSDVGEEVVVGSEGEARAGGEDLVRLENSGVTYGSGDVYVARSDKSGGGRRGVSDAFTAAIPTNNTPPQRDAGARAGNISTTQDGTTGTADLGNSIGDTISNITPLQD